MVFIFVELSQNEIMSNPGVGKLRSGGHMRPVKLFSQARLGGINYIYNP